jgi:hypothetical protein
MSGGPIDFAALRRKRKAALELAAERSYCKVLSSKVPHILLACTEEASRNNGICLSWAIPAQNYTTRKHALKRLESSLKQTTDIVRSELRARKVRTSCAAAYSHFCIGVCRCLSSLSRCLRSLFRCLWRHLPLWRNICDLCRFGSYISSRAETGCDWETLSTKSFNGAMRSRTPLRRLQPRASCVAKRF